MGVITDACVCRVAEKQQFTLFVTVMLLLGLGFLGILVAVTCKKLAPACKSHPAPIQMAAQLMSQIGPNFFSRLGPMKL